MADTETTTPAPPPGVPAQFANMPLPPLDMSWKKAPTVRPPRPLIGEDGFTLRLADNGAYGIAPDRWPYENDTPRGAFPSADMGLPAPYTIYDKVEVWAENAADLYELAIRERWKPATEISWTSIEPLAEHVEAALDQIVSNISEQQYNSCQVLMGWLMQISYGFHEVKLYLATQAWDLGRHVEAFRKRALANGGGLGVQAPGFFNRAVYASFKFTELVVYTNILRTSMLLGTCEVSGKLARSQADRQLFDLAANDLRRHLSYGIEHLKYYAQMQPQRRKNINTWLNRGEFMMAVDWKRDTALREAYILALGDTIAEGKAGLKEMRQAQLKKYLLALEAATIYGHEEHLAEPFRELIENP